MRLLTSKSNFAKNRCKISMAALVPFLLFGCSGGKTGKSDAGEKSKDIRVQTTGSEEQRKLAMGATAVPGVSVSAVFGADADKLMAFGLKELGKSGDSLSLAGPVYKLSATAGLTPGPDGCFAILPVTSGSICFDEMISASRFLVPSMVPGTSGVPGLGLTKNQQNSSNSSKFCTKAQQGFDEVCYFVCGIPPRSRPKPEDDIKSPVPAAENLRPGQPAVVNLAPEKKSTEGPVTTLPVAAAHAVSNNPQQNEPTPSPDQFFSMPSMEPNASPTIKVVEIVSSDNESLTGSPYPVAPTPTSETTTETLPMPSDQITEMVYAPSSLAPNTDSSSARAMTVPPGVPMSIPSVACDITQCPQEMPSPTCIDPKFEPTDECCPKLVCAGGYSTPSCEKVGCSDGKICRKSMCASCAIENGVPVCPPVPCTYECRDVDEVSPIP